MLSHQQLSSPTRMIRKWKCSHGCCSPPEKQPDKIKWYDLTTSVTFQKCLFFCFLICFCCCLFCFYVVIVLKNLWLFKMGMCRDPHYIVEVQPQTKVLSIYFELPLESLEKFAFLCWKDKKKNPLLFLSIFFSGIW